MENPLKPNKQYSTTNLCPSSARSSMNRKNDKLNSEDLEKKGKKQQTKLNLNQRNK